MLDPEGGTVCRTERPLGKIASATYRAGGVTVKRQRERAACMRSTLCARGVLDMWPRGRPTLGGMKRALPVLSMLCLLCACSVGMESYLVFYPPDSIYQAALTRALEAQNFEFELTDQGGIAYAKSDASTFDEIRNALELEPRTPSGAGLLLVPANRVEVYAELLTEYGIEFQTRGTEDGTQFVYSSDDFELASRLYAEVQVREIAEQQRVPK